MIPNDQVCRDCIRLIDYCPKCQKYNRFKGLEDKMPGYNVLLHVTAPEGLFGAGEELHLGDIEVSRVIQDMRQQLIGKFALDVTVESCIREDDVTVLHCPCCKGTNAVQMDNGTWYCPDDDVEFTEEEGLSV
jgi:hypothetical protein